MGKDKAEGTFFLLCLVAIIFVAFFGFMPMVFDSLGSWPTRR